VSPINFDVKSVFVVEALYLVEDAHLHLHLGTSFF
jgi:hypothetical protein